MLIDESKGVWTQVLDLSMKRCKSILINDLECAVRFQHERRLRIFLSPRIPKKNQFILFNFVACRINEFLDV